MFLFYNLQLLVLIVRIVILTTFKLTLKKEIRVIKILIVIIHKKRVINLFYVIGILFSNVHV